MDRVCSPDWTRSQHRFECSSNPAQSLLGSAAGTPRWAGIVDRCSPRIPPRECSTSRQAGLAQSVHSSARRTRVCSMLGMAHRLRGPRGCRTSRTPCLRADAHQTRSFGLRAYVGLALREEQSVHRPPANPSVQLDLLRNMPQGTLGSGSVARSVSRAGRRGHSRSSVPPEPSRMTKTGFAHFVAAEKAHHPGACAHCVSPTRTGSSSWCESSPCVYYVYEREDIPEDHFAVLYALSPHAKFPALAHRRRSLHRNLSGHCGQ